MFRFICARVAMSIPTLLIVGVTVFMLIRLIPGDPAALMLGDMADPASLQELRQQLGLDRGLPQQLLIWFGNVLQGDLGVSISTGESVTSLVLQRFTISAPIVLCAVLFASLVAVPAGMIAAWRQNKLSDTVLVSTATLLLSVPTFWLGLLFLLFFGLHLGWLPVVGYVSPLEDWRGGLLYLIMPITTLFLHEIGVILRMARASTLDVLRLDYVTHARAKGLSERVVLWRHAF